jgi:hypothetical protein
MSDIIASIFGFGTGNPPQMQHAVSDFRDANKLMQMWGEVNRRRFTWYPEPGERHEVWTAMYPTAAEANAAAARMALEDGYKPPRWWELWRRGESALPS